MKNYSWPSPFEDNPHSVSAPPLPEEIVHAVGAIVIAWTHCEQIQLDIVQELAGYGLGGPLNTRVAHRIFEPMGNRQRDEVLMALADELVFPEKLSAAIAAFRVNFNMCLANRNLIAHALFVEEEGGPLISSSKAHPRIQERYIPDDAAFWEETIFEMRRLYEFGLEITNEPMHNRREPWPTAPQKPRDLASMLPLHVVERAQSQSLEGR